MLLTPEEARIVESAGFSMEVANCLRSQSAAKIERMEKVNDQGELVHEQGLSIIVAGGEEAERLLNLFQPDLLKHGYRVFWSHRTKPSGRRGHDELIVLKTTDHYAIVRVCGTNGANHRVYTHDILDRLESWEKKCDFDVVGASHDWVALKFRRLPERVCDFAVEIYQFCPDTVDQGVGLAREASDLERFAAARQLCPDVSAPDSRSNEALREFGKQMPPEQFENLRNLMEDAAKNSTPVDMGIRLVAHELTRAKYLFLWWD